LFATLQTWSTWDWSLGLKMSRGPIFKVLKLKVFKISATSLPVKSYICHPQHFTINLN